MVAYKYRIPAGIPGATNRNEHLTAEAQVMDPANPVTLYGVPVKIVSGQVRPVAAADAATVVYGFLIRPYPTTDGNASTPFGGGTPRSDEIANVMRRGYMTVKLNGVTAATKNGGVYVRVADPTTDTPIGGLEAGADGGDCVLIPGCVFMGPADAAGNTEIAYNI